MRDVVVEALERRRSGECVVEFTRDAPALFVAFGCGAECLSKDGCFVIADEVEMRSEVEAEAEALPRSLVLRVSRPSSVSSPPTTLRSGLVAALGDFLDFVKTPFRRRPTGEGDLVVVFFGGTRPVKLRLERREESVDSTDCVLLAELIEVVDRAEAISGSWSSSICDWGSGKWDA